MLPNGKNAVVPIEKLTQYCLSPSHPRGRHKARVFLAVLRVQPEDAEEFRRKLLHVAETEDAVEAGRNEYGIKYLIDFTWTRGALSARVRSLWILPKTDMRPRFLTCFILR